MTTAQSIAENFLASAGLAACNPFPEICKACCRPFKNRTTIGRAAAAAPKSYIVPREDDLGRAAVESNPVFPLADPSRYLVALVSGILFALLAEPNLLPVAWYLLTWPLYLPLCLYDQLAHHPKSELRHEYPPLPAVLQVHKRNRETKSSSFIVGVQFILEVSRGNRNVWGNFSSGILVGFVVCHFLPPWVADGFLAPAIWFLGTAYLYLLGIIAGVTALYIAFIRTVNALVFVIYPLSMQFARLGAAHWLLPFWKKVLSPWWFPWIVAPVCIAVLVLLEDWPQFVSRWIYGFLSLLAKMLYFFGDGFRDACLAKHGVPVDDIIVLPAAGCC
ncbi:hypothetical protein B0H63DRAFT_463202 [Podospora didyma]|uniref:Uncharacterized protein n=1 Tax=Podospora didyma TaxID=330526 RepID=A0AAE0NWQ6_9PEZI|nr:hypothetical protein B0H63DRAFT_463202 [Podospora didyma]